MKIAIDTRVIEREMSGIARYLLGFLNSLTKIDNINEYILLTYNDLPKFKNIGFKVFPSGKSKILPEKIYNFYWLQFILKRILKKQGINIFWNPNHYLPLGRVFRKSIITLHDNSHLVDKGYKSFIYRAFYLNFLLPKSVKNADIILTVSENSKRDIVKFYKVSEEKIKVIYEAADEKFKPRKLDSLLKQKLKERYNFPDDFILYVGRIERRKNILGILKILDLLEKMKKNINIVLVGSRGYSGYSELKEKINKRRNLCHIEFVEEDDLPYIYNLAKIFLFPSFYEGFGLPALEAMQSGLPVLTSNTSSLPEVVGDGGIMHSPNDYESFTRDVIRLLEDESFYQEMKKRAINQAKKFSWKKSAEKLVKLFNEL